MSWWRRSDKSPPTRLSAEQAIAIAREAAAATDPTLARYLTAVEPRTQGDRLVWIVASVAIGAALEVVVDDVSGNVLHQRSHEGR